MGLFDIFKKDQKKITREKSVPEDSNTISVSNLPKKDEELTPDEIEHRLFETAMNDPDAVNRSNAISSMSNQYWLYRLVKEGTYENDRMKALEKLTDQEFIFRIIKEEGNIPRIYKLAQNKLDDFHRLQMISVYADYVTEIDKKQAVAKISDAEILKEIINHAGWGRAINLEAAGRLERIAPEEISETLADHIKFLREMAKGCR